MRGLNQKKLALEAGTQIVAALMENKNCPAVE